MAIDRRSLCGAAIAALVGGERAQAQDCPVAVEVAHLASRPAAASAAKRRAYWRSLKPGA